MKLLFTTDHRFLQAEDGSVWTETNSGAALWRRYVEVFEEVRVLARLARCDAPPPGALRADLPGVSFAPIPNFRGPAAYLRMRAQLGQAFEAESKQAPGAALLLRLPSQFGSLALASRRAGPYGIEVAGDPYDAFSPGAIQHPLRPVFRHWFAHRLRSQANGAAVALYVTHEALQRRYPSKGERFAASDVELPEEAFVVPGSRRADPTRPLRLILVGSLEHRYKAPDAAIEAVALCRSRGIGVELSFVGDGREREGLESLAIQLGVRDAIDFLGWMPSGSKVRGALDRADVFVLPSRQEGMPRAMLEAMARGLAVIGARVGGIPELLDPAALVEPGDPRSLATAIATFATNTGFRLAQGERNLEVARRYRDEELSGIRRAFLQALRQCQERASRVMPRRRKAAAA